jgi:hypothetical protein
MCRAFVGTVLFVALAIPASAQPLWFQFTGTTAGLPGSLEFLSGKHFMVTLRLDSTKLDADPNSPEGGLYYGAVTAGLIEVVIDSNSSLFWTIVQTPYGAVDVTNRPPGQPDNYQASAYTTGPLNSTHFIVQLTDRDQGTAFDSDAFPTALKLNDFEYRNFQFLGVSTFGVIETYEIVPGLDLTDTDGDGIPDEADNCPALPNANQADLDLDLLGDLCDPFPNDSDNEKAQCRIDLSQCLTDLAAAESSRIACVASLGAATTNMTACTANLATAQAALASATADSDGDGLPNAFDKCVGTIAGSAIDSAGCSIEQFCGGVAVNTDDGKRTCAVLDWRNDEPMMTSKQADCRVDRFQQRCVPNR